MESRTDLRSGDLSSQGYVCASKITRTSTPYNSETYTLDDARIHSSYIPKNNYSNHPAEEKSSWVG